MYGGRNREKNQDYHDIQRMLFGNYRVKGKKNASKLKWLVVGLSWIIFFSLAYSFDLPASLKTHLFSSLHNTTNYEVQFGLLYSLYALPNIFLPISAGFLIDQFGASNCAIIFCLILVAGHFLFSFGIYQQSWLYMYIGRFLLGFGGESFRIANYALLPEWFGPNELGFANAVGAIAKFGNVATYLASPYLAIHYSLETAIALANYLAIFSLICIIVLQAVIYRVNRQVANNEFQSYELVSNPIRRQPSESGRIEDSVATEEREEDEGDENYEEDNSVSDIDTILNTINADVTDDERSRNDVQGVARNRSRSTPNHANQTANQSAKQRTQPSYWTRLQKLDTKFWLLALSFCFVTACLGPFNNIASTILLERDYFKPIPSTCQLTNSTACQSETNPPLADVCPSSDIYQLPIPSSYAAYKNLKREDIDCTSTAWKTGCTESYCHRLNDAISFTSYVVCIQFFVYFFFGGWFKRLDDDISTRFIWFFHCIMVFLVTHLLFAISSLPAIVLMVGQGMGGMIYHLVFWSLIARVVDQRIYGFAFGILLSLTNLVNTVMPIVLASVYDHADGFYIPNVELCFVIATILALCPLAILYFFRDYFQLNIRLID